MNAGVATRRGRVNDNYAHVSPEERPVTMTWRIACGVQWDSLRADGRHAARRRQPLPWAASDPRPVWKIWDEFGIGESRILGWWEKECPFRTGREDVLAAAYVKPGKTLIALASWAPEKAEARLQLDWKTLGLDASKARLVAPEINDFQPAKEWKVDEPITVEPRRGWLIYLSE
jgi:hypothetical protein